MPQRPYVPSSSAPPGARWPVLLLYLVAAVVFSALYLGVTLAWKEADFRSFAAGGTNYPLAFNEFKPRVLVPLLARALLAFGGVSARAWFRLLAVGETFALLLAFRAVLAPQLAPRRADAYGLFILWPLAANEILLNRIYFPFDLPAVLLVTLAYLYLWRRQWRAYYPVLALAALNREASAVLIVLFVATQWGRLPRRAFALHLAAQCVVWGGALAIAHALGGGGSPLSRLDRFHANLATLADMARFRGKGPHDWLKLLLAFGGLGVVLPFTWRRQPAFVQASAWAILAEVLACGYRSLLGEMRVYGEIVPMLAVPGALALAAAFGHLAVPATPAPAPPDAGTAKHL